MTATSLLDAAANSVTKSESADGVSYVQRSRGTLIATLSGADDGTEFDLLSRQLLELLHAGEAIGVVIDASHVTLMDLHDFARLRHLAKMVRTMGVPCMLCGVQAAVAATLVDIGADIDDLQAFLSLDDALDALAHRD